MIRKLDSLKHLKALDICIENKTLEMGASDDDLILISSVIKELKSLESFTFSITGQVALKESWSKFSDSLATMQNLQSLKLVLKENDMNENGLDFIGKGITALKKLRKLSFCSKFNLFGNQGVTLFFSHLIKTSNEEKHFVDQLEELHMDVAAFKVDSTGVITIFESLKHFQKLQKINIEVTTCSSISKALIKIRKFKRIIQRTPEIKFKFYLIQQNRRMNMDTIALVNNFCNNLNNPPSCYGYNRYQFEIYEI